MVPHKQIVIQLLKSLKTVKKKIMLVDDKSTIAKVIAVYLGKEFEVIYFENPIAAIDWINEGNTSDLIITDINMPQMRGDEFLRYLKKDNSLKDIPVIILSGEDSSSDRIRLLEEGADDYIVKPFNPMELQVRVKKLLN